VSVTDEIGDHVSCAYAEKFVACGDRLFPAAALMETLEAVPARAPVAPLKVYTRTYLPGPYKGKKRR
jgi:hypothetical protein